MWDLVIREEVRSATSCRPLGEYVLGWEHLLQPSPAGRSPYLARTPGRLSRDPVDFRTFQGDGTAVCPGTPWTFVRSKGVGRPPVQGPHTLSCAPRGWNGRLLSRDPALDFRAFLNLEQHGGPVP